MPFWRKVIHCLVFTAATASLNAIDYSTLNINCGQADTTADDKYAAACNARHWNLLNHLDSTPTGNFYNTRSFRPAWLQNVTIRAGAPMQLSRV